MSPTTTVKRVVLIGASGNLGAIVLPALIKANFEVTVLSRNSSSNTFPPFVKVVQSSYTEDELVKVFSGQDAVVSTVGASGFAEQKTFIDAAIRAGVKRFIPSELSTNTNSAAVRELVPIFEAKKTILDYLKEKEGSGLTWTGLAVGLMLDWGLQSGFLGFDLKAQKAAIWDDGETLYSATNQQDVGKAVAAVLQHPAETANQYLYVHTATVSQKRILQALEKASGNKWSTNNFTSEGQIADGRKKVSEGDFSGMFNLVQASAYGAVRGTRANYTADEQLANSTLGLEEGNLDDIAQRVLSV